MKAVKIVLVLLGILCLVVCFWYRSGHNEVEEGTRQWRTVGLNVSPWYRDEKVTKPDGSLASSKMNMSLLNFSTFVGFAALGCFKLAGKIGAAKFEDETLYERDQP